MTEAFNDAQTAHAALVERLAEDPYVEHVMGHLESGIKIDHPIKNWKGEMVGHLQQKYGVSLNIAHSAISMCRANVRHGFGGEPHGNET